MGICIINLTVYQPYFPVVYSFILNFNFKRFAELTFEAFFPNLFRMSVYIAMPIICTL